MQEVALDHGAKLNPVFRKAICERALQQWLGLAEPYHFAPSC